MWIAAVWIAAVWIAAPAGAQESADTAKTIGTDAQEEPATAEEEFAEEIVVTARRREENPQQIPISITTFSDTALEERSMVDLSDLGDFTPNLSFATTGGFSLQTSDVGVVMRGVGQIDPAIFSDPGVGIYVDGVFLARAQGAVLDLLELERVEVLRGPQGTLFGKNTTGGAISLITRKPTHDFGARLEATVGEFDRRDLKGSVHGALGPKLWGSLALLSTNRDGFTRSLSTGEEYYDDNRDSGRLSLRYQPSPSLTLDLTSDYTRERENGGDQILLAVTETPLLDFYNRAKVAAGLQPITEELWGTGSLYETYSTFPNFNDTDVYGTAVSLDWVASPTFGVRSITAYRGFDFVSAGDLDGSPLAVAEVTSPAQHDQFSQELHLTGLAGDDRVTWLAGVLYFRERPRGTTRADIMLDLFPALEAAPGPVVAPPGAPPVLCDPGPPPPGVPCFGGAGNPANLAFFNGFGGLTFFDLETTSWAVFGEGTYEIGPKLSATFGIRYSRDDKSFEYVNVNAFGVVDSDLFNEDAWDAVTPRFSLSYQVRPEVLLFFTASRGYKSGGFNGRPQQRQMLDPFDPETVLAYEVGVKGDWLDHRLRLNGAAFFSDYDDIHFAASLDVDGVPVFVTQNAGTAEITGFELELTSYPAAGLTLTAGAGYTRTELVEVDPTVPVGLAEGGTLPKAPEWTVNSSLQYAFNLERGVIIARADYNYRTKVYNDLANNEGIAQGAYGLWNARLLYSPPAGRWDLALFGTNLTDEEYLEHGFVPAAFGFDLGVPGRPREWGLTAQYRF